MTNRQESTSVKRRVSITQVAQAAGVSKAAVSKVIRGAYGVSPAMRDRVQHQIAALGYRPTIAARAMRGATYTIGIDLPNIGNEFLSQIIQGASERLIGTKYQLLISPGGLGRNGTEVLENLVDHKVDGVIAVSPEVSSKWLESLAQNCPVVLVGRHGRSKNYDTIASNDALGVGLAMKHLRDLGHTQIAHLTISTTASGVLEYSHYQRRIEYENLMRNAGLEPMMIFTDGTDVDIANKTSELLLKRSQVTAILAGHDTIALGVLGALNGNHLTHREISVVGFDDIPTAGHPLISLTTVSQFGESIGNQAADLLLQRISEGRTSAKHVLIEPVLRERKSTKRI